MANWTPTSFSGELFEVTARYGPPPRAGAPRPTDWGDRHKVEWLFAGLAAPIDFALRTVRFETDSLDAMRQLFEAHGMAVIAKQMLPPDRYQAMMTDVEQLIARHNEATDARVSFESEYLLVVAHKV